MCEGSLVFLSLDNVFRVVFSMHLYGCVYERHLDESRLNIGYTLYTSKYTVLLYIGNHFTHSVGASVFPSCLSFTSYNFCPIHIDLDTRATCILFGLYM